MKDEESRSSTHDTVAALGQVMAELVHDLNNELAVLQGWAVLARGELEAGRHPIGETERVVEISQGLGEMLRDILAVVARERLSPEVTFDPRAITEETLSQRVRAMSGLTVRMAATLPPEVRVAGRASFWRRVLSNLLGNASRYARREIRVGLAMEPAPGGASWVVLTVEDDGPGIGPEERAAMFRPFWRGEQGEHGLGLSAVVWASAQLGGDVVYREGSTLGGAAFQVKVPAAAPLVARPAVPRRIDALRGARVVVVEDEPAVREALCRLLERAGAEVREIDPRWEPEEVLLHSILSAVPEVILLDLRMGDRGGVPLFQRIRGALPPLAARVVFMTGAAPGEPEWEAARETGQPLLGKPFDLRRLGEVVHEIRARK